MKRNLVFLLGLVLISMTSFAIEYTEIYVNQKNGDDYQNNGFSRNSAFKTISHALSLKKDCSSIYVTGGHYSSSTGERFPLNLPYGTKIQYSEGNNEPLVISGSGLYSNNSFIKNATLILNGNNWLNSVEVESNYNTGLLSLYGDNIIQSSIFSKNSIGIDILNNSKVIIKSSYLFDNNGIAIKSHGKSNLTLINTTIKNNNIGVSISDDSSIGFNHENKSGRNIIQKNNKCDLFYNGNRDIYLDEITWDSDPFDFSIRHKCINGNNIVSQGFGDIHYQLVPNENQLLFDAPIRINLLEPYFSEIVYSTTPTFSYNTTSNKLLMIAIWSHLPKVQDNKILNLSDIVWYWHSGMKNSPLGIVEYNNGRRPINNDLNPEKYTDDSLPIPLKKGYSYYWAVWEWDSSGLSINASSAISYFKVSENTQGRNTFMSTPNMIYNPRIISSLDKSNIDEIKCNDPLPNISGAGSVSIVFLLFFFLVLLITYQKDQRSKLDKFTPSNN